MTANNSGYLGTVIASSYQLNSTLAANVATMTANNSTNFAGQAQGFYANVTSPSFTTSISVGANVSANTLGFFAGNATVNLIVNSTSYIQGNTTVYVTGNSSTDIFVGINTNTAVNSSVLLIGNATVNATINSTVFTGTANNTSFVGTVSAANVVSNAQLVANLANYYLTTNPSGYISAVGAAYVQNTDSRTLSGNLTFSSTNTVFSSNITSTGALITAASANLFVNNFSVGNSTVNSSVNSTIYTGTANNATNLGGTAAASYQLNSTLAANVATMTANNTSFVGSVSAANVVSNTQLVANLLNYYPASNPSGFISSIGGSFVQNTDSRTLSGNLVFSGTNTTFSSNITSTGGLIVAASANLFVNNFSVGNTTVNASVNSTIYTGTANNTSFVGTISAANVVSNAQLVANLANYYPASNPSGYVNSTSGSVGPTYVQNTDSRTLSGNLVFTGTNTVFSSNITSTGALITAPTANLIVNNFSVGNTTVNASVNSTVYSGTANNATNLGGVAAASYQLNSTLAANVATMTANNTSFVGTVSAANVVSNAQLIANLANYYLASNPSGYISSIGGSFVQNTDSRTLSGNLVFSGTNTTFSSNITSTGGLIVAGSANLFVNNFSVGNSTVNASVNSTIYTGTANNTSFVGTVSAANVVSNAQLIANLANYYLASNPSGYISAVGAAYVQNTDSRTLSGNLTFSGTNTVFSSNITSTGALITAASANLFVNNFSVGNTTVNASVNSTIYTGTANNATNLGGTAAASYQLNSTLAANVATMTANNSTNFGGHAVSYFANVTSPQISNNLVIGSNTTPDVGLQLNVNYGIGNVVIATSNNINVNCALGNFFNITCNGSAANIYFTSTPAAIVYSMILVIANGGTNTISWANTPAWPGATAPTASTNTDIWVFFTQNGGTTWRGNQVNKDNR
jgi:hypothetical protein